eukprot:3985235-Amphidinium_carterae.1
MPKCLSRAGTSSACPLRHSTKKEERPSRLAFALVEAATRVLLLPPPLSLADPCWPTLVALKLPSRTSLPSLDTSTFRVSGSNPSLCPSRCTRSRLPNGDLRTALD